MHDVKAFFESYREIWERTRDGRQIAEFYHAPTLSLRGDGSFVCLQTADEIVQFFQSAADNYHKQGWERWAFADFSAQPLGARSALTTMRWQASREDGTLMKEWQQSYNLVRFGAACKIVLSTLHVDA